jgi:hypothetical protein
MTVSLLRHLALGLTIVMAACTSSPDSSESSTMTSGQTNEVTTSDNSVNARENMREGWQDVKEGTEQAATGVGQKTKETSREITAEVKEMGREVKATACPVVGDRTSKRYYTKADKNYEEMLKGEKLLSPDNRECFMSERAALDDGYTKAR